MAAVVREGLEGEDRRRGWEGGRETWDRGLSQPVMQEHSYEALEAEDGN